MVVFNYSGAEINAKVVYYGPALSGKTTNLEYIYQKMPADTKGKMVSMKTRTDRTLFFDFLPLELGEINGYRTRILLYTVPGQVYYNATRKLVLKGADAVVFIADSAPDKMDENVESLRNLEENLNEHGLTLDTIPWVIQYNKRDLPDALPASEMTSKLNLLNVPSFEATATTGQGIYETFQSIAGSLYNQLVERLKNAQPAPGKAGEQDPTVAKKTAPSKGGGQGPAVAKKPAETIDREVDEATMTNVLDTALREVDSGLDGARSSRVAAMPSAPSRKRPTPPPAPAAARPKDSPDTDFEFPPPPDVAPTDDDVGRVIDFDEEAPPRDTSPPRDGEFIVDPFHAGKSPKPEKPTPPPRIEAVEPTQDVALAPPPPPPPPPVEDATTIRIPVFLKRSQMRKSIPIKVELDIQIDDEEA